MVFQIVYIDPSTKIKVDKLTGKTYKLYNGQWTEIETIKKDNLVTKTPKKEIINDGWKPEDFE
jgi:hypothetical protein